MCIFHHACCSVFSPLWWIWAVPLLRHCLRVAQWVWLIDGRQWLSPLESKHFCVVSPLKVLLSLLREKTLFVYSHSDGAGWQLLLKRRERLPLAHATLTLSLFHVSHLHVSLSLFHVSHLHVSLSLDLSISLSRPASRFLICIIVVLWNEGDDLKCKYTAPATKSPQNQFHPCEHHWLKETKRGARFPFDSSRRDSITKSWK